MSKTSILCHKAGTYCNLDFTINKAYETGRCLVAYCKKIQAKHEGFLILLFQEDRCRTNAACFSFARPMHCRKRLTSFLACCSEVRSSRSSSDNSSEYLSYLYAGRAPYNNINNKHIHWSLYNVNGSNKLIFRWPSFRWNACTLYTKNASILRDAACNDAKVNFCYSINTCSVKLNEAIKIN